MRNPEVCLSPRFRGVYSSTKIVPESCDVYLSHRFTGSTAKRPFHESVYWFAHPLVLEGPTAQEQRLESQTRFSYPLGLEGL